MADQRISDFCKAQDGAIAPLYALSLFGLIGISLVGFDYARLMTLNSELQNAADQAALAAATQLDGRDDAITRARAAANTYFAKATSGATAPTYSNLTYIAQDENGANAVTIPNANIVFYSSYTADAPVGSALSTSASDQKLAKVVQVTVANRTITKPLTPITDILLTANSGASAMARMDGSICKLPPMLVCAPAGSNFPASTDIGKGLFLKQASGAWFPGNFGYVDLGNGGNTVKQLLGTNSAVDTCVGGGTLTTEPGQIASATNYLNTRFDIYSNPLKTSDCASNGDYCPARNTRKDLVIKEVYTFAAIRQDTQPADPARPTCGSAAPSGGSKSADTSAWVQMPTTSLPANSVIGFPRDTCHNTGNCAGGNIGDGAWNVAGYRTAHPNVPTSLTTRYAIYKWERDNPGSGLQNGIVNTGDPVAWSKSNGANPRWTATWTNYCSFPNPVNGTYHATAKDRRLLTVAVVDCTGQNGKSTMAPTAWMDIFLTEPSWNRSSPVTDVKDIYGEIASVATQPNGSNAFQYYSRGKAVLIR